MHASCQERHKIWHASAWRRACLAAFLAAFLTDASSFSSCSSQSSIFMDTAGSVFTSFFDFLSSMAGSAFMTSSASVASLLAWFKIKYKKHRFNTQPASIKYHTAFSNVPHHPPKSTTTPHKPQSVIAPPSKCNTNNFKVSYDHKFFKVPTYTK